MSPTISFREALMFWLKLGFVSFGGPAGQIAIMQAELVEKRHWISQKRFLHALNYCMLLPGPEAQQLATYIGWLMHKTRGGLSAGLLFILPSLFIIIGLAALYLHFQTAHWMRAVLSGVQPAIVAIVLFAAYRVAAKSLKHPVLWVMATAAFVAVSFIHIAFPWVVLTAALLGLLIAQLKPDWLKAGGGHGAGKASSAPALIDDDTPTPPHAQFKRSRLLLVCGVCFALFGGVLALVHWVNPELTRMAWFFSKAALLTFGGAYAVLPYVYQGAVVDHQWLTAAQMMDGLALGESTPGPLIMVVSFVGYLGGVEKALFGANNHFLSGAVAATVVTFFTFLPSFFFILAGGPMVETTRHIKSLHAPLTAISAAVVGVMVSLAWFFSQHSLWANGPDWKAISVAVLSAVALFGFKQSILRVLPVAAVLGYLLYA
jgi:chromate transporter